jgi:hypothetical protein
MDAERETATVDAAYSDRVSELFRILCISVEALPDPQHAIDMYAKGVRAARQARDIALGL